MVTTQKNVGGLSTITSVAISYFQFLLKKWSFVFFLEKGKTGSAWWRRWAHGLTIYTALWPGLNFFLCLNILIKNPGWSEGEKVKKVEIKTKFLWCTLFLQELITYTLTYKKKKCKEAFKKRRVYKKNC